MKEKKNLWLTALMVTICLFCLPVFADAAATKGQYATTTKSSTVVPKTPLKIAQPTVTGAVVQSSPPVVQGANYVTFNFTGSITTNGPTTVKYRWIRSDGAQGPETELVFDAAGTKNVTTSWQLVRATQERHLWEAVQILSPKQLTSNQANITVPALATATGSVEFTAPEIVLTGKAVTPVEFTAPEITLTGTSN